MTFNCGPGPESDRGPDSYFIFSIIFIGHLSLLFWISSCDMEQFSIADTEPDSSYIFSIILIGNLSFHFTISSCDMEQVSLAN